MKKINFVCMRHSYHNSGYISESGVELAIKTREELNIKFDAVFYSYEGRAMQTGWIMANIGTPKECWDYACGSIDRRDRGDCVADFAPLDYRRGLCNTKSFAAAYALPCSYERSSYEDPFFQEQKDYTGIPVIRSYCLGERGSVAKFIKDGIEENIFLPEWSNVLIVSHQPALRSIKEGMQPCEYVIYEQEI